MLRSNGVDRVRSLRKILTWLRGMNFCTSSALSLVRQPNSPKCTKIEQIARKQKCRVQWGGSGAFVAKNSKETLWHEQLHQLTRFALSVVGQNKCTQIVWNAPKHEFRVQWGLSVAFVVKKTDGTSWHEVFHQFDPFYTKCCYATKLSQMHPNNTKHSKTWF